MAEKAVKTDLSIVAYIFGVMSIILGILSPLAGIVFGFVGLTYSKKQKTALSQKGRKFSTIGIIIGIVLLVVALAASYFMDSYLGSYCEQNPLATICQFSQ